MRRTYTTEYPKIPSVSKQFELYAKSIGYHNSNYLKDFIEYLEHKYYYLHKIYGLKKLGKWWDEHSTELMEKENTIRQELNDNIKKRNNPVLLNKNKNHITISEIANFVFCPVTFSIRRTYETNVTEEMALSVELKKNKQLEEFLDNLRKKRRLEYFFDNYVKISNEIIKSILETIRNQKPEILSSSYFSLFKKNLLNGNIELILDKRSDKSFHSSSKYRATISGFEKNVFNKSLPISIIVNNNEYEDYVVRFDFGELLKSKVIFKGYDCPAENARFNDDKSITGIPDYIYENPDGEKFIVLEKHTQSEINIDTIHDNHRIQLLCYLHFLFTDIKYGYVVYFSPYSKHSVHIHKISISDGQINEIKTVVESVFRYVFDKQWNIEPSQMIVPQKCFGCSDNPYCYHKTQSINVVKLPYNIQ